MNRRAGASGLAAAACSTRISIRAPSAYDIEGPVRTDADSLVTVHLPGCGSSQQRPLPALKIGSNRRSTPAALLTDPLVRSSPGKRRPRGYQATFGIRLPIGGRISRCPFNRLTMRSLRSGHCTAGSSTPTSGSGSEGTTSNGATDPMAPMPSSNGTTPPSSSPRITAASISSRSTVTRSASATGRSPKADSRKVRPGRPRN